MMLFARARPRLVSGERLALAVALLVTTFLHGCGSPCTVPDAQCHGNELWVCEQIDSDRSGTEWYKRPCGPHRYCRVGTDPIGIRQGMKQGVCAAEPDLEPACLAPLAGPRNLMSACTADGRAVRCMAGYMSAVQATCASPALCIAPGPVARC